MKITFLGGGNMANAIIGGLLATRAATAAGAQAIDPKDISVLDVNADSLSTLARSYGVVTSLDPFTVPLGDVIVVAVKPQNLRALAQAIAPRLALQPTSVVLSIAAGIRIADLSRWLGGFANIVRSMPNTPALVHAGISGLFASEGVSQDLRDQAERVLKSVGETIWFEHESDLDIVTAVSGSGPAYVFYFIEALTQAGVQAGLNADAAQRLALATFAGAAKLAVSSPESPATLRERVTSKGGTTERGLAALREAHVTEAVIDAVAKAGARSKELGDQLGAS
jgi:pyrroline-5-carboxylate reductase